MGYKLAHLPLFKLAAPLIAGLFFFNSFTISFAVVLTLTVTLFLLLLISHYTIRNASTRKINAVLVYSFIFMIGGLMISNTKIANDRTHFSVQKGTFAKGMITKPLEEKEKTYRTVIAIHEIVDSAGHVKNTDGNLLVYFQKDSTLPALEIGDAVLFHLNYQPVEGPKNPGQFDYRNYLQYKSIYHQQYIRVKELSIIQKHRGMMVSRISNSIGTYVQSILKKYIPGKERFSLADGILLGHRADIDVELYNAFAYTGILHILSVSGLHVGIIYGMLLFFLSFIKDKNKMIKIGKFIFILLFIWLFAFVTGFSPACVRAAILFSLLNFGKLNREHVSNLNLLCGAAILQLLIDPNTIFDIGFQLSYLAMLGLFIFYKPIYALFYHPNKLIDWTWKLWSASIAAQVFTVPLSIYYFGNFPTYFLFANIFAIPLSAVILWLSIALIPFSYIPFLATIIGWLDSFAISIFIQLTYFFSKLPEGKLNNLYITREQLLLLLIAITFLTFFIIQRNNKFLLACLSLFLATILISYSNNYHELKKKEIILYAVPKNLVIAVNTADRQMIFSKDSITEKNFQFSIKNSFRQFRIDHYQTLLLGDSIHTDDIYTYKDLLYANGKCFYLLNKENNRKLFSPALKIDYLVLTDNCYLNIKNIQTNFAFRVLLLSPDNDQRHIRIYKEILKENGMKYKDLNEKALVIEG